MKYQAYPAYKDSGVEWLGKIPEGWKSLRLRFLFQIVKNIAGNDGYDILSITQQGIKVKDTSGNDGQIAQDYSKYQFVLCGDFAMNHMDLLTGFVDISQYFGVTSPDYRVFRPFNSNENSNEFLLFIFQMCYHQKIFYPFGQGASQLGRWRLPTEAFKDFCFPIPPLPTQQAIAAFLDTETARIDGLIKDYEELVSLLQEKRQALISHAVTRGLSELVNPDDPEFGEWAKPVKFKDSGVEWLGEIPEGWGVKALRQIASIVRGASPRPAGDPAFFGGSFIPWVTVAEVTKDTLVKLTETDSYLTEEGAQRSRIIKTGTLIYTNSGATLGVPKVLGMTVCANDGIVAFEDLADSIEILFLYFFLFSLTEAIRDRTQGSGQPNLNTEIVKSLKIAVPERAEQQAIAAFLDRETAKLDTLVTEAESAIELLKERRSALITNAVTGKIKVDGLV